MRLVIVAPDLSAGPETIQLFAKIDTGADYCLFESIVGGICGLVRGSKGLRGDTRERLNAGMPHSPRYRQYSLA